MSCQTPCQAPTQNTIALVVKDIIRQLINTGALVTESVTNKQFELTADGRLILVDSEGNQVDVDISSLAGSKGVPLTDCQGRALQENESVATCQDLSIAKNGLDGNINELSTTLSTLKTFVESLRNCEGNPIQANTALVLCSELNALVQQIVGDTGVPLTDCEGRLLTANTAVATCIDLKRSENDISTGITAINNYLNSLRDCDNASLPTNTRLVTCANLEDRIALLPTDKFLSDVGYNPTTQTFTFTIEGGNTITVNAADLIPVATNSSIDGNGTNADPLSVALSSAADNTVEFRSDGLYVAPANAPVIEAASAQEIDAEGGSAPTDKYVSAARYYDEIRIKGSSVSVGSNLDVNTIGNTAVGVLAMNSSKGEDSIAIGYRSLHNATYTGADAPVGVFAAGAHALEAATEYEGTTAVGADAGRESALRYSTVVGRSAGKNATADYSTAVGRGAATGAALDNTAVYGNQAGRDAILTLSTAIGVNAAHNARATALTAVGNHTGSLVTATGVTAIGHSSLYTGCNQNGFIAVGSNIVATDYQEITGTTATIVDGKVTAFTGVAHGYPVGAYRPVRIESNSPIYGWYAMAEAKTSTTLVIQSYAANVPNVSDPNTIRLYVDRSDASITNAVAIGNNAIFSPISHSVTLGSPLCTQVQSTGQFYGAGFSTTSDARQKTDIEVLSTNSAGIENCRFTYLHDGSTHVGWIAQQVLTVLENADIDADLIALAINSTRAINYQETIANINQVLRAKRLPRIRYLTDVDKAWQIIRQAFAAKHGIDDLTIWEAQLAAGADVDARLLRSYQRNLASKNLNDFVVMDDILSINKDRVRELLNI